MTPPGPEGDRPEETGRRGRFNLLVTAVRWLTLVVGLVGSATGPDGDINHVLAGAALMVYAVYRTGRPIRSVTGRVRNQVALLVDLALPLAIVVTTGRWESPYTFALVTTILLSGFYGGARTSLAVAALTVIVVAVPYRLALPTRDNILLSLVWGTELALVSTVGSYARRLAVHARDQSRYVSRLRQLSEANALLLQLHALAQRLPQSMDLDDTVTTTVDRLREILVPDVIVVVLREPASTSWTVVAAHGVDLPSPLHDHDLPAPLAEAASSPPGVLGVTSGRSGMSPSSGSGMYAPLRARDDVIGLIAVERRPAHPFEPRDLSFLQGFAEQAALALDNARWFRRLRTMSVEQERGRIARDLHDRLGQSLAYIGLELDRVGKAAVGTPVHDDIKVLREEVGGVVRELRDTLYDLRADVSEERDLVTALGAYLGRVGQRSGLRVDFHHDATSRLDLAVERELWRIAQEGVRNAERHSGGSSIRVYWRCDDRGALLEVTDDGQGISGPTERSASFGILGMRERADAVGATLDIGPAAAGGTTVVAWLDRPHRGRR